MRNWGELDPRSLYVGIKDSGSVGGSRSLADAELESSHGQEHVKHQAAGLQVQFHHKQVLNFTHWDLQPHTLTSP